MLLSSQVALATSELPDLSGYLGKNREEITLTLKGKGYEVRKVESEDGYLEAYARKNGERYEIYVDPKTARSLKSSVTIRLTQCPT